MKDKRFYEVYKSLYRSYGPQGWWPVTPDGEITPRYTGGPGDDRGRFEVAVGAILTQNTAWVNASLAIERLNLLGAMSPRAIAEMTVESLAEAIRPAGYFRQKAARLRKLAIYFLSGAERSRRALLALEGIGPETADSILLYAWELPFFVVDAYTRRIFGRLGLVDPDADYECIRASFESNIPRRVKLYQEYHALIVEHGKRVCKKEPECKKCLLRKRCKVYLTGKLRSARERRSWRAALRGEEKA